MNIEGRVFQTTKCHNPLGESKDEWKVFRAFSEAINNKAITIADAKRGDIGNSSKYYAECVFEQFNLNRSYPWRNFQIAHLSSSSIGYLLDGNDCLELIQESM